MMRTNQFQNPFLYHDGETHTNPDPYVIRYEGRYYCYSSDHNGVQVSMSENLTDWQYLGFAVSEEEKQEYWAPAVIYHNGVFYMYCSNTAHGEEDCHQEFLQIYTSTEPQGPFRYMKTLFQKFSIDAHVVRDIDGEVYLFYSVNDYMGTDGQHPGTVIMVDRLIGYTELAHEEQLVVAPSVDEEIFEKNRFGDGRDWYTIEGAFFLRHHDKAYMMYAANAYVRENYFVGYSRADGTQRIRDMKWEKYPDKNTFHPLIRRNEKIEGTGHNSVIKAPNMVDDWIIYHGRNREELLKPGTEQRQGRLDQLFYSGERLVTPAPGYQMQDSPEFPLYQVFGKGQDVFIEAGESRTLADGISLHDYVIEAAAKCKIEHMGAQYGLILFRTNESNFVELILNSGKRSVEINWIHNNTSRNCSLVRLPAEYRHDVTHQIRVERICTNFRVYIDEVLVTECEINVPYGQVGTIQKHTEVDWGFLAVTEHTDLHGSNLCFFSNYFRSSQLGYVRDGRVQYSNKKQVVLQETGITDDSAKSLELEFQGAGAKAEIMVMKDFACCAVICARPGSIQIYSIEGGKRELVDCVQLEERRFTVHMKQRGTKITVCAEGKMIELEADQEKNHLEIHMQETDVCSYSCTTLQKEW